MSVENASLDYESDLVDLGGVPLRDLLAEDDSVFAYALRRIQDEADNPEGAYAGWQSAL